MSKFNYKWNIKDGYPAPGVKKHDSKVFSTFACGGGSSMGYKLAGYDVIGANDIDPKMRDIYITNHNPKHYIFGSISEMKTMDLPEELFDLDILDGSPPCSTFSVAGQREKNWKKEKKFREGQSEQVLSDLFFDFIDVAERLKPKVIIAENVKGMLIGNAKLYTKEVVKRLGEIGYKVQVFLLNAASMGVPQRRERVFFICYREDLDLPKLKLEFNENPISFGEIKSEDENASKLSQGDKRLWEKRRKGDKTLEDINERVIGKNNRFTQKLIYNEDVPLTITASDNNILFDECRNMNKTELCLASSFPLDYNFLENKVEYIVGMSVPPVMMAQVADQVYKQWLSKLGD
jgi:DNA (cytosine-5)-methyltransferase 1